MRKIKQVIILCFLLTAFTCSFGKSQTYNTGIGLRGGLTSGITIKHFVSPRGAIEAIVSIGFDGFQITGLYEWHKRALEINGLYWFYGLGGHIGSYNHICLEGTPCNNPFFAIGIDGILGIEWEIREIPFTVGLDFKPFIQFPFTAYQFWDIGLSVRYVF